MNISSRDAEKALRIKSAVTEFFNTSSLTKVPAKDLMSLFIQKGIFTSNHRDGLPIRNFLRHLAENDSLSLIPQVHFEQKAQNRNWYFIKITR